MNEKIEKFSVFLSQTVGIFANKISSQKHIMALRDGMMFILPFSLIGGLCMILMYPPVSADSSIAFFSAWAVNGPKIPLFALGYFLTMGILSVYAVIGVAYQLAKSYDLHPGHYACMSLMIFLCLACPDVFVKNGDGLRLLALTNLDASGMFTGIVVAMTCVSIGAFMKKRNLTLKLPDTMPPNVAAPFEVLIPFVINYVLFVGLNELCTSSLGFGLVNLIANILAPLLTAADSLPSAILYNFLVMAFWFFGIHGNAMMQAVFTPVRNANLATNAAAIAAGTSPTAVFSGSFPGIFGTQLMFVALLFALVIKAKSSRLKSLTKLSFVPNILNINETLLFGLPLVMNLVLMIPVLICTILNTTIAYICMSIGLVGKVYIATMGSMPAIINAFLSTLDVRAVILWILLFIMDLVIFLPFVHMYDKQIAVEDHEIEEI